MQKLIVLFITLFLTSCGYHLRGAVPLAPTLQNLYLKTPDPYGQLTRNLRQSLKTSGIHLTNDPKNASAILTILDEQDTQQLVSISGTQRIQQYNLIINVTFQITHSHGAVLISPQVVNETRALTIKADQILGGSNEATNLYQQMRQAIVYDIMNRLASKDITSAPVDTIKAAVVMKLTHTQLMTHLTKNLAPIYLISGDELLLVQETFDAIRKTASQAGFTERMIITAESATDWGKLLYSDTHSLSLFANKKIIELNLSLIKISGNHVKILEEYAKKPLPNTLLIIHTAKLDTKIEKTTWYQALEKNGIVVPIWPINEEQLPQWIIQRVKKMNLTIAQPAAERLATLVEGNLLAAAQEIEKLGLLQPTGTLDVPAIETIVADNARFDIFILIDSLLVGNAQRSLHILQNLAAEGIEPTLILWGITRELRMLTAMLQQLKQQTPLSHLFQQFRIWEKRQRGVRAFLQRQTKENCWKLLVAASKVDRMIKGTEAGNVWDALQDLVLKITTNAIVKNTAPLKKG